MGRAEWDERYRQPGFVYGTAANDFLVSMEKQLPKGRILSLAEGEGRNGVYLASRGYDVTGVDGSAVGLAKALRLAEDQGVALTTVVADLADYRIEPGMWDGIISLYCHIPSPVRGVLHRAAVQGLRPGGIFLLEAFGKGQLGRGTGGPPSLDLLMDLDELRGELEGLEFLHAVSTERDVREGRCHTGIGSVVQVVGRKPSEQ